MHNKEEMSLKYFGIAYEKLADSLKKVIHHLIERKPIARNIDEVTEEENTFGQRAADKVASFGGSWAFIGISSAILAAWIILNSVILVKHGKDFDPYPYILLNLTLSMLSAMQAPIILMSQNRQAERDRKNAEHDYEINLKAELEIIALHDKVDALRQKQWAELVIMQQEQIELLKKLIEKQK